MNNKLFVVSAPSGAGKSSLLNAVRERMPEIGLSTSWTTRAARPGEIDGDQYRFVSKETFRESIDADGFLEWAEVFGNFYGTPRVEVEQALEGGATLVLELDWQGAASVKRHFPEATSVFILPPSVEELERRLRSRGQDDETVIAGRMAEAREQGAHWPKFDRVLFNDDFEAALDDLESILRTGEPRRSVPAEQLDAWRAD